jgi:hypothetical protein
MEIPVRLKPMTRREFVAAIGAAAAPAALHPQPPLIPAPLDPARWPVWRAALLPWRAEARARLNYDDRLYRRSDFAWVPSSFACSFLLLWNLEARDMDTWLAAGERDFGGYDSVVFSWSSRAKARCPWPTSTATICPGRRGSKTAGARTGTPALALPHPGDDGQRRYLPGAIAIR